MAEKKICIFKTRYDNDEEFREKHKKYMLEKTQCDCGLMITRNYMTRHKRTIKHANQLKKLQARVQA